MKHRLANLCLIAAVGVLCSACSIRSFVPSTTLVSETPTPMPAPFPTTPPLNPHNTAGFDSNAGNCPDAANASISLANRSAGGEFAGSAFSMDMHLSLTPSGASSGCSGSPTQIQKDYRQYVSGAHLTAWPLTSSWGYSAGAIRQQWLAGVLDALLHLYPRATITVNVINNGFPCGSASIGGGATSLRAINGSCG